MDDSRTYDEQNIKSVLIAAREVQDYLWGKDRSYDFALWYMVLEKRLIKLADVDLDAPGSLVEVRKRLLQTAAVAVAWMSALDKGVRQ